MKPKPADVRSASPTPWLVALVIFGPFAVAALLYYGSPDLEWLPRLPGSRELIDPSIPAPAAWLGAAPADGSGPYPWSLIYARMAACEQQCLHDIERLRQVHGALGRDAARVQRIYLQGGEPPTIPAQRGLTDGLNDPDLLARRLDDAQGAPIVRALGAEKLRLGRVLIADPRGDLVASYPAEVEQKELLRDLKRLLSVSGTN
jgi:hypothetical protein